MASKGEIRLKSAWRPTSLIGVINGREDLSDIEKVRQTTNQRRSFVKLTNHRPSFVQLTNQSLSFV